jgi:hypothetical protein
MKAVGSAIRLAALSVALCAAVATGQSAPPSAPAQAPAPAASAKLLTLGTPLLRSTMDRMNLAWLYPSRTPDFRLKVDRQDWGPMSVTGMESRIRGVEIRLPMEGLWVGYELPAEDDLPRATFSIQRGF